MRQHFGWEVTVEDVANVLKAHNITTVDVEDFLKNHLDLDQVIDWVMHGAGMEEQTNYAAQAIEEQLEELGYLPKNTETKFPV